MLARRIENESGQDNYRALALYIADASLGMVQGEKTFHSWYAGGEAGNYLEGLIEAEATQAMNKRSQAVKTYHLMVSFRPEDEAKLTPEILENIESTLAESLGFTDHQRHCGVHHNTNNMHLHVGYNMIHPRKFTRHAPFMDYLKLSRACRALEAQYGLVIDKGMEPGSLEREGQPSARIKSMETHTGQESLFSYTLRHKDELLSNLESAANWQDVHREFLKFGLLIKPAGAGLTIKDRFGKHYVKPSSIDCHLSQGHLTGSFGGYEEPAPELLHSIKAKETYSAKPLHQSPERDQLYELFCDEMTRRKAALEDINCDSASEYGAIKKHWGQKRDQIDRLPLTGLDRQKIRLEIKEKELGDLASMRLKMAEKRNAVRVEFPYTSWTKCLQHKAALGNETALTILRSKKETVHPKQPQTNAIQASPAETSTKWLQVQKKVLEAPGLSNRNRQSLLSVIKMKEVIENMGNSSIPSPRFSFSIDTKGTVIFRLADGNTIRDTGSEIHFNAQNKHIEEIAAQYGHKRWGPSVNKNDSGFIKIETIDRGYQLMGTSKN